MLSRIRPRPRACGHAAWSEPCDRPGLAGLAGPDREVRSERSSRLASTGSSLWVLLWPGRPRDACQHGRRCQIVCPLDLARCPGPRAWCVVWEGVPRASVLFWEKPGHRHGVFQPAIHDRRDKRGSRVAQSPYQSTAATLPFHTAHPPGLPHWGFDWRRGNRGQDSGTSFLTACRELPLGRVG